MNVLGRARPAGLPFGDFTGGLSFGMLATLWEGHRHMLGWSAAGGAARLADPVAVQNMPCWLIRLCVADGSSCGVAVGADIDTLAGCTPLSVSAARRRSAQCRADGD